VLEHFDAGRCFNKPDEVVTRLLALLAAVG
jgi:hypothetical protein